MLWYKNNNCNGVNKMTKKDYIKFATLLKTLNVKFDNKDFTLNFNDVYNGIVNIFKSDNHRFDEVRFKNFIRKV